MEMSRNCLEVLINKGFRALAKNCPKLKSLALCCSLAITESAVLFLLEQCNVLEHIKLQAMQITNETIKWVVKHPTLISMDISSCSNITDIGMQVLADGCQLQRIVLSNCKITDQSLGSIAKGCKALTYVNLSGTNCTDTGVQMLTQGCSNITNLILSNCQITDLSMKIIAEILPNIKLLNVSRCETITDEGIKYLMVLEGLEELVIVDCPSIAMETLEAVPEKLPKLKITLYEN
jgi:hypothetical protein